MQRGARHDHGHAIPIATGMSRGYRCQGSMEIAAPGALYAVDFLSSEEKISPELLPPAAADRAWGCKIDGEKIKERRRETVHRSGAAPKTGFGYDESADGYEKARLFAQRALELNPNSGTAYSVLASVNFAKWDWAAAERDGEEGLRLEPRNPRVLGGLANLYRARGRWVEGARLLEIAISLDPLNPDWHLVLSWMQYSTGNLRDAETEIRKAIEISPTNERAHRWLGHVLMAEGKLDAALTEMQQDRSNRELALVYYAMGQRAESDAALAKLMDQDRPTAVALAYAYRRQLDQAFTWLERAYGERDTALVGLKGFQVDPLLKNFAHDPRFAAFLQKMNLPE